jgi:hypothetical protein
MNWEAISAIGQMVGAIAVVISLIYLTREVRNNARATRLASMRSLSEAINQYFKPSPRTATWPSSGLSVSIPRLKIDPVWDPIRNDPAFQQLLKMKERVRP